MQKKESNILMVGGNARKSGKTSLICRLLEQFGRQYPIIAVKVAIYADKDIFLEHFPLARNKGYLEIKEEDRNNKKDSGKYLAAGALESWFLAATLKNILRVHERIDDLAGKNNLMILESNTMRKFLVPGLFLLVDRAGKENKNNLADIAKYADLNIKTGGNNYEQIEDYIYINQANEWQLNN